MANEFSFMFINIEDTLAQYKEGLISKDMVVEEIQYALNLYKDNTSERATIEFNAGEELTDIKFVGDGK